MVEFQTSIVKHSLNPVFEQTFTTEVSMSEFKLIRLKIQVFDADRHTKTTEIGSTSIALKEIKMLRLTEDPVSACYHFTQKKQGFGELLFGLTYLPTAQRLSFSVLKGANLRYEEIVERAGDFRKCFSDLKPQKKLSIPISGPYVRILQVDSTNGKVVKKKKTRAKSGTRDPEFNETLNFDMAPDTLADVVFLVLVSHRSVPEVSLNYILLKYNTSSFAIKKAGLTLPTN